MVFYFLCHQFTLQWVSSSCASLSSRLSPAYQTCWFWITCGKIEHVRVRLFQHNCEDWQFKSCWSRSEEVRVWRMALSKPRNVREVYLWPRLHNISHKKVSEVMFSVLLHDVIVHRPGWEPSNVSASAPCGPSVMDSYFYSGLQSTDRSKCFTTLVRFTHSYKDSGGCHTRCQLLIRSNLYTSFCS